MSVKIISNEIISDDPLISVVVVSYNHKEYINSSISSILEQITEIPFEIIIHDDCSTVDCMQEFNKIISNKKVRTKIIIQEENRLSKGCFEPILFAAQYSKARYIAICEGDDYWIDPYKLQKQFEYMLNSPNLGGCFHPAFTETPSGERALISNHSKSEHLYSAEEVILGDGGFCPTASLFIERTSLSIIDEQLLDRMPCGDYFIQVAAALNGGLGYLPEPMSVYRLAQENSFSAKFTKSGFEKRAQFYGKMCDALEVLNQKSGYSEQAAIKEMVRRHSKTQRKYKKAAFKQSIKRFLGLS